MGDSDTSFTESLGRSDPIAPSLRRIRMESSGYQIVDLHRVRPLEHATEHHKISRTEP